MTVIPHSSSASVDSLIAELAAIVGRRHVLTTAKATRGFRNGFRFGSGPVAAVVRPGRLIEQWQVLQVCVASGAAIIMQAANTGLTGGSTPDGDDYDRPVIIVSTRRLKGLHLIDGGRQVLCLPGATLHDLERALKPLSREPHSVIGSSCIGASVLGGVCNNSGGALIRRGPAYTELALYARLDPDGRLVLVNHLGVQLGKDPESILKRLESGAFDSSEIMDDPALHASDPDYARHVRDIEANTPARFNADPRRLFEASGSAGKLAVFAVRLDTFPEDAETAVFYVGANDPALLARLRRDILSTFGSLPIAAEYMHRDCFDIADRYGKDTVLAIEMLGTERLPGLFAIKAKVDAAFARFGRGANFSDRLMQLVGRWAPDHLPPRMRDFRDRYQHHLMLKMSDTGIAEAREYLHRATDRSPARWGFFECTPDEGRKAFLHRFAAAGAAVRYRAVHSKRTSGIVALDFALPRNTTDWFETLPSELEAAIERKLYYGHFLCHVFHHDYIVSKDSETDALEHALLRNLDRRGAEYPAEHNVGHHYAAKPALSDFYRQLDPRNALNPGIGRQSKKRDWGDKDRTS